MHAIEISDEIYAAMSSNIARTAGREQGVRTIVGFEPDASDVTRLANACIRHGVGLIDLNGVASKVAAAA